jgi:type IV pilus assembly protein PilC
MASSLPLPALLSLCRAVRHGVGAGLPVARVFRQQSRSGPPAARAAAGRVADALEAGTALEDALKADSAFPPLFSDLAAAGEEAGSLEVTLAELEDFYDQQLRLRRQFWTAAAWPLFQFVAAVVVVTILLLVLGLISGSDAAGPVDPLGMGLVGVTGAAVFLGAVAVVVGLVVLAVWAVPRMRGGTAVERALLAVPAIGPALRALALTRFALVLRLTWEAGMSVPRCVRRAFQSAGNAAFADGADAAAKAVRRGEPLTDALRPSGLFPDDFLEVVALGEETGQVPEVLARHGVALREEAGRRVTALAVAASVLLWLTVVVFLIVLIFRVAAVYIGTINALAS